MPRETTGARGGWSAVVYGRTYRIDRWWRALPEGVEGATAGGPLGRTVLALVCGGARLDTGPRFVLDRGAHGVLVGAACRMPLLGPEMAYDEHGRPLYGFVGWHHPDREAAHDLPRLGELEASFPHWAAATYRAWAGPLWDVARETDAVTLPSTPEPAPWARSARPADPAAAPRWLPAHSADVHLLPAGQAAGLWDAALAAGPMADCVLATGWQQTRDAREPGLTHSCCADVTEYRRASHTAPSAPARAAAAPAREPVARERAQKPGRPPREKDGKGLLARMGDVWRSVVEGDRPDARPSQARPARPAQPHDPAGRPYLTGRAAYEHPVPPVPPAPGLLARAHAVDAEQASYEGYFGAFGAPPPAPAPAPDGVDDAQGAGGPEGREAGTATPCAPGGPRTAPHPGRGVDAGRSSVTDGSGAPADPGAAAGPPTGPGPGRGVDAGRSSVTGGSGAPADFGGPAGRPMGEGSRAAPGPGGAVGAGWLPATEGPGTPGPGEAARSGADGAGPRTASGPGGPAGPGTTAPGAAPAPGGSAGAWGALTPDADGPAGHGPGAPPDADADHDPDDPNRSHPGGSA
ncbi:hypothetical protein ABTX80_04935 [Streptomyces erythrochromogenes]|uniref:hypothetical protein n=1 Tax=Streptomyces erythrochromogenes TaxID=285574 RepID=UPI003332D396